MLVSHEKLASQFKIFRISKVWLSFSLNDKYLETCSQSKILLEKSHFCVKFAGFSKMRVWQQNICFIWNIHTKVPGAYHLPATHATYTISSHSLFRKFTGQTKSQLLQPLWNSSPFLNSEREHIESKEKHRGERIKYLYFLLWPLGWGNDDYCHKKKVR